MEYKFLLSYILILIALYYSYKEKLGIEKTLLINSLRAFIQLLFLGYILSFIFTLKNPLELLLILFLMIIFASYTGQKRTNLAGNGFITAFLTILISSSIVLSTLLVSEIVKPIPNQIIPIGGMIIGNSLNVYSLTIDRMKSEIKDNFDTIENVIALGGKLKNALHFIRKNALKSGMIPMMNMLQTVGIVHIPGITTGMLLAGANPFDAVSYQLAIMYMMVAVALFTGIFSINFGYTKIIRTVSDTR